MALLATHNAKLNLFGNSCTPHEASVIVIPVPWAVTVSSRSSTTLGPESILKASYQMKSSVPAYIGGNNLDIAMLPIPHDWKMTSDTLRHHTLGHIHAMESGLPMSNFKYSFAQRADQCTIELKEKIKAKAHKYLKQGKMVAILGGDHSTPMGLIEALADYHNNMGILHIGAQPAMRETYKGIKYSHASIMHNALELAHIVQIVQLGLRNCSPEEVQNIKLHEGRVHPFYDSDLKRKLLQGTSWHEICASIIALLPERVYISFNIDGLDAKLCPSTGAPVPNGLELYEVCYLIENMVKVGIKIVGFDLCEVAPGENMDWDAQVGSQVLQHLCVAMRASQTCTKSK